MNIVEKSIHNRPKEVDKNKVFGYWKLNCVEGIKENKKIIQFMAKRDERKFITKGTDLNKISRKKLQKILNLFYQVQG